MNVAFVIAFVGDYHAPRLACFDKLLALKQGRLFIFQRNQQSDFYSHAQTRRHSFISELNVKEARAESTAAVAASVFQFLRASSADAIVVLGYSDLLSLVSLAYAKLFRRRIIFLSDSKADDQQRGRVGELAKRLLLRGFDGALVAGHRHAQYFRSLGFTGPINVGYDVVDNSYFEKQAGRYRRKLSLLQSRNILPKKYILCVSRLVSRKRIDRVLRIFKSSEVSEQGVKLIIVGSGPERLNVDRHIREIGLEDSVCLVPNVDNSRMPLYYAFASALILASDYDQWGLCVNEAMACGTPVIVSERCGAAGEIVIDGDSGVVFDGDDLRKASTALTRIVQDQSYASRLSAGAKTKIAEWNLEKFGASLTKLVLEK